jgi:phage-related protein (TIGR01555 family)
MTPRRPYRTAARPAGVTISAGAMMRARAMRPAAAARARAVWTLPAPPPGVIPADGIAMDSADGMQGLLAWAASGGGVEQGLSGADVFRFPGYVFLSELSQRPEYRRMVGCLAQEMTRKWCRLTSSGDDDKQAKLTILAAAMKRYRVRDVFRTLAEHDGTFGRMGLLFDTGHADDPAEMEIELKASAEKVPVGGLKGIRAIEPIWTYPGPYNSTQPIAPDFYRPEHWYCNGQRIHRSRLYVGTSREVPDILKPSYMFGGVSLIALAKPYVDAWLRTKTSVADLLDSFTTWVLKTNLAATLGGGDGTEIADRADLFCAYRSSRGLFVIDKETEDLGNISVPLSGLDQLQAQSQEHMASVDGMPLVVLLGITPHGLGATAEPEMDAWRNRIHALQEHLFNAPLARVMDLIQLSEFGLIDREIGFEWLPLEEESDADKAARRKTEADTAKVLIDAGVISPDEERQRLAAEEGSAYGNLDLSIEITPPGQEAGQEGQDGPTGGDPSGGAQPPGGEPDPAQEAPGGHGGGNPAGAPQGSGPQAGPQPSKGAPQAAHDTEHWITAHPNGGEGVPLLVEGGLCGVYTVKGGAGGKLDGKTVTPTSMSKALPGNADAEKPLTAAEHTDRASRHRAEQEKHQKKINGGDFVTDAEEDKIHRMRNFHASRADMHEKAARAAAPADHQAEAHSHWNAKQDARSKQQQHGAEALRLEGEAETAKEKGNDGEHRRLTEQAARHAALRNSYAAEAMAHHAAAEAAEAAHAASPAGIAAAKKRADDLADGRAKAAEAHEQGEKNKAALAVKETAWKKAEAEEKKAEKEAAKPGLDTHLGLSNHHREQASWHRGEAQSARHDAAQAKNFGLKEEGAALEAKAGEHKKQMAIHAAAYKGHLDAHHAGKTLAAGAGDGAGCQS